MTKNIVGNARIFVVIFFISILVLLIPSSIFPVTFALSITGTSSDEHLKGTNGWDYISGQAGDDFLQGSAGSDSLYGRDGNDKIDGGKGNDRLSGGKGEDYLVGGRGDDTLTGGLGADKFDCGPGEDTVQDFSQDEGDTTSTDCENVIAKKFVVWIGKNTANDQLLQERLQSSGIVVQNMNRPITSLNGTDLVVIDRLEISGSLSAGELTELKNYVQNGGRLIITGGNEYFYCDPPSTCTLEFAREFGFAFAGDIQSGPLVPIEGEPRHQIWTTPNLIYSFEDWCCDAYVSEILDPDNVRVLGIIQGSATSVTRVDGEISVSNVTAIVVNEDPNFNGGKVLGIGEDMFEGLGNDEPVIFDNVIHFMLT